MTNRFPFPLRWNDNDQYGHMNNTVYYEAMDSGVNTWMMRRAGLDPAGEVIGLARASSCEFLAPASFPDVLEVDIAVARLGTTSITWDLAILREGAPGREAPLALGRFTHVFVDRARRRPVPVPAPVRAAVEAELRIGEGAR
ncbi:acyl-CoA thioesterase [Glycomyces artemisiae]|uniref:Acyl-CoA thioester hydrolase n=1 Tax=Glycomyces artemisiae TaxID=1076443 RepID=A0A2T0UCW5_9ACTN|nr:thioesterase family protein [Glycomyces artemisiae]PRY55781.1 acyl-CoA thioester hydrolase [Glycomyces artemisiae]